MNTLNQQIILKWAYLFHWATVEDFVRAIAPGRDRLKGVEYSLPRLVKKKKLKRKRWGNKYVYALPGTKGTRDYTVQHGLRCTDALIRFHLAEREKKPAEFISERELRARKFDPVPELAVYLNGDGAVILLFEYSTADNFRRKMLMEKKMEKYKKLDQFREEFDADPYLVFVIEAPEDAVKRFAQKHERNSFYFTSANKFYSVPYGKQLDAPIYFWRGEEICLT